MFTVCLAACCCSSAYAGNADSLEIFRTVDLREVIVSVNRDHTRKINTPQHIVSVPKSFIDYANKQSTADLLGETGQVLVQKSQQGGGSPILRGFEASRILLVVDGVRMNNLIYRSGHLQNCLTVDQFALKTWRYFSVRRRSTTVPTLWAEQSRSTHFRRPLPPTEHPLQARDTLS